MKKLISWSDSGPGQGLGQEVEGFLLTARVRERASKHGVPEFLCQIEDWLTRKREIILSVSVDESRSAVGQSLDELQELIDSAFRTWDQDPFLKKITRRT